jgi:hypothetical protein
VDAGDTRMRYLQGDHVLDERRTPFGVVQMDTPAIHASDPRDNAHPGKCIKEPLGLDGIYRGQMSIGFGRAKMRENISYVVPAQLVCKSADGLQIKILGELARFSISDKPPVPAQPAVRKPQPIVSTIVSTISDVEARGP